ncbi:hypothetical protein JL720_21 [Aureococcus anophagefferens]|nr:hypothetical protein JL720_21 [Aureococcus anophagefferens]
MKAALAALLAATAAHALVAPVSRAGRRAPAPLREAKTEEKATEVQLLDVEECRVDPMTRVKQSGKAGIAAYTITEFAFWLGSVPLAIAAVAYTTGSLPDVSSVEGKEAVAGYVFINFARVIVPARIALALALAPWAARDDAASLKPGYLPPHRDTAIKMLTVIVELGDVYIFGECVSFQTDTVRKLLVQISISRREGVEADFDEAKRCFARAATKGHEQNGVY